jgi:menaquinone-specific isochorismate synthase
VTRIRTIDLEQPPPLLDHRPPHVWIGPGQTLIGFGEALRVSPGAGGTRFEHGVDRFLQWCDHSDIEDDVMVPGSGPVTFGSFTFDQRSMGSVMVVPEITIGCHDDRWFLTLVDDADPAPLFHPAGTADPTVDRPRYAGASVPDVHWLEAVAEAVHRIDRGELDKVVLARDFAVWSKERFDPKRILISLEERFPNCHVFAVDGLLGASPELLVRVFDRTVESLVLAGSAARSTDPTEDERIGKELLASDKDQREHEMAAASVGRVLGEVCERMFRDPVPILVELANVRHLGTRFRGRLGQPVAALELAGRLHPTAAVGGTPTARAVALIDDLEGMDRGRYAGPVGWMDASGDGEFAIALRCAEISGARARLFAGAGIVEGSLPENELEETRLKLQAMLEALE